MFNTQQQEQGSLSAQPCTEAHATLIYCALSRYCLGPSTMLTKNIRIQTALNGNASALLARHSWPCQQPTPSTHPELLFIVCA